MLGQREPGIYGSATLSDIEKMIQNEAEKEHIETAFFQSNSEGDIVSAIQAAQTEGVDGIILNAGAYTHYSIAIRDAIAAITVPVVEVHLSNVYAREDFRHISVISPVCKGVIAGFGPASYLLAMQAFIIKGS
jgi:3-dehydroquinate dehydratase-2